MPIIKVISVWVNKITANNNTQSAITVMLLKSDGGQVDQYTDIIQFSIV